MSAARMLTTPRPSGAVRMKSLISSAGSPKKAAAIAYRENRDTDSGVEMFDQDTINGSISVIHTPTGLNLTFAAGQRDFNDEDRDEATFYYIKGGINKQWSPLGNTSIYGEYGQFDDVYVTDDASGITGGGMDVVRGSEAKVYGFGIVQHIDAAAMQLYAGFRHYEVDLDIRDSGGIVVAGPGIEDFSTVMVGGRIDF